MSSKSRSSSRRNGSPQWALLPPIPWTSSSGGPSPRRSTCSWLPATGTLGTSGNGNRRKRTRLMTGTIDVLDRGRLLAFSFDDMLKYHGPGSPGGVAQAFKLLERGMALLGGPERPPERREIHIRTAFGGPGARDAI